MDIEADADQPVIKYFEPADADYNSVWPPVEMPPAPPKIEVEYSESDTVISGKEQPLISQKREDEETPQPLTDRDDICALAAQARAEANASGTPLTVPPKYAQLFGTSLSHENGSAAAPQTPRGPPLHLPE